MLSVLLVHAVGFSFKTAIVAALCAGCNGQGLDEHIIDAVISPDGRYFAKSTAFGTIVYEVQTGKTLKELKGAADSNLKFSGDSKYLATGQLTDLTLWDLTNGKPLASWKGVNRHSFKMDFPRDGSLLAVRDDKSLRVWETATQKLLLNVPLPYEMDSLAFSPDGKFIAVGGTAMKAEEPRFHEIRIWAVPSGKSFTVLKGPEYCIVKSLVFSSEGNYLATGLSNLSCRLWDLRTQKECWTQKVDSVDHDILTFSMDGKQLIVGGFQLVTVLDIGKGTEIKKHTIPGTRITSLTALVKAGHLLVTNKQSAYSIDLGSGQGKRIKPSLPC